MRYGFTTGSCAAAAAKAAAYMLLTGREKTEITIETPKGILYTAQLVDIERKQNAVQCAVIKDGGDDPDITTGAHICAKVSYAYDDTDEICRLEDKSVVWCTTKQEIRIDGGIGVGKVTKPGLDQPIGNAAINHVPREMIEREVRQVCNILDYKGNLDIEISVPEGEQLAKRTFNPRLGIIGGISILGTSGIVEPMSNQAILDTIRVEMNQRKAQGFDYLVVSLGNYGLEFMKKKYGYDLGKSIKCSNFIGAAIDMAADLGFQKMLLIGHIGKLIKVAGGIMNTHSKEADCRLELLAAFAIKAQIDPEAARRILNCATTSEAVQILQEQGKLQLVMEYVMERICFYLEKRADRRLQIDCILYVNDMSYHGKSYDGELAKSKGAESWFTLLAQEQAQ